MTDQAARQEKKQTLDKARERSVSNLQRLYGVVISLAITVSLQGLFEYVFGNGANIQGKGLMNYNDYQDHLLRFVSFIVTRRGTPLNNSIGGLRIRGRVGKTISGLEMICSQNSHSEEHQRLFCIPELRNPLPVLDRQCFGSIL